MPQKLLTQVNFVEKKKERLETRKHHETDQKMSLSIFFDGRKDRTLSQVKKENKIAKRVMTKRLTCVKAPGSEYLGHIVVSSGNSQTIASGIIVFFE